MTTKLLYRYLPLLALLLLCALETKAQQGVYEASLQEAKKEEAWIRGDKLKAFRITGTGNPVRVEIPDTITLGTHHILSPESRSLGVAYAGNANMPWQSKIFFDRDARLPDFVYLSGFQGRLFSPRDVVFYDTRTPFTFVHYRKNFADDMLEDVLTGTMSFNLGKAINVGASADYSSADGYYNSNRSRNLDYRIFGSFRSDRYDLWAYIANDYHRQGENAGVSNIDYILNPDRYSSSRVRITSKDVPVYLPDNLLYNRVNAGHAFLSHRYKLGYRKVLIPRADTTRRVPPPLPGQEGLTPAPQASAPQDSTVFVPVGSISHQVYYSKQRRHMVSRQSGSLWVDVFGTPTANFTTETDADGKTTYTVLPDDTAQLKLLHNTIALSLLEGFRPWVKAGLSAYLRTENYWVSNPNATTKAYHNTDKFFSAFVGAELARRTGRGLNFELKGELGLLGKDLGALSLEGELSSHFRLIGREFALRANARLLNSRPSYFAGHHHGTFGWWDKDFSFSRRLELGGRVDLASWGTWAELRTASLQNHLYWSATGEALQHAPLIQMTMLRLGHSSRLGILAWQAEAAYQLSGNKEIIPVPMLTARADVGIDFLLLDVLRIQIGAEGYWHTAYYAPYYHPGVMQFVNQSESLVGGKAPLLNLYANFRHKNTRFYVRMFNVGEAFMTNDRLSMHKYPYNPMHLQAGVVVDLRN